ncbi:MAG: SHOCT domain-containing protein [Erysipelotrichaceae bacterium]
MMNVTADRIRDSWWDVDRFSHMGWFGEYAWLMPVLMILFWALVIGLIVYFVRRSHKNAPAIAPVENKALRIVKERYAKGEITKEEFDRLINDLKD